MKGIIYFLNRRFPKLIQVEFLILFVFEVFSSFVIFKINFSNDDKNTKDSNPNLG